MMKASSVTASARRLESGLLILGLWVFCHGAFAALEFDLRPGVTDMSQRIQGLHHISLAVCVVMGVLVFGAMGYSMYAHRRSRNPKPADFHDNTLVEVIWTTVPVLILVVMAIPATTALIDIEDNSDADLTVLITASQWKWHYQYVEADIGYYSNMATPSEQINTPRTERRALFAGSRQTIGAAHQQKSSFPHGVQRRHSLVVGTGLRR